MTAATSGALVLCALLAAAATSTADENHLASAPVGSAVTAASADLRFDRNGRYGVFTSQAGNLAPGLETFGRRNVYLYDRIAATSRLVSHRAGDALRGSDLGVAEGLPQISADGKWVAYTSPSTDLVDGQVDANGAGDVFLWSRETDTTVLVSRRAALPATAGAGESKLSPGVSTLSDDGRYLLFASAADDLVAGQSPSSDTQLYFFDRDAESVVLVSHSTAPSGLVPGSGAADLPGAFSTGRALSGDGRFAVFTSLAPDHVPGLIDQNQKSDVFLWDRDATVAASLRLLSRSAASALTSSNQASSQALISADGTAAVFVSSATNLEGVAVDNNNTLDIFRFDRLADQLELVSHRFGQSAATGNGAASSPSLSADGRQIAFESAATNLVLQQDDDNGGQDVFLWRGQIFLVSHAAGDVSRAANGLSSEPRTAEDGGVAFSTLATDLVAGAIDQNSTHDVYFRSRQGADLVLISHLPEDLGTVATSRGQSLAGEPVLGGALLPFESLGRDLVAVEEINIGPNVYFHGSLLMADGFESGDLSAWSQVVP